MTSRWRQVSGVFTLTTNAHIALILLSYDRCCISRRRHGVGPPREAYHFIQQGRKKKRFWVLMLNAYMLHPVCKRIERFKVRRHEQLTNTTEIVPASQHRGTMSCVVKAVRWFESLCNSLTGPLPPQIILYRIYNAICNAVWVDDRSG